MEKIGILIEMKDGEIKKANYGLIAAAHGLQHELYALLLDPFRANQQRVLAHYGVHRIVVIATEEGPIAWNPFTWAEAISETMEHFGIHTLLGLSSFRGKDVLPRIAARIDAPLLMDCIHLDLKEHKVHKSQYSGKTVAVMKVEGANHVYGIRPNVIEARPAPVDSEVITYRIAVPHSDLIVREIKRGGDQGVDLSEAEIIISGGRGMENPENFKILFECAEAMGATVGASRAAVDAGWVPYAMQVGQTGVTVSPRVYMACGISGSIQHFAGMKTAGLIVAINRDPTAAIIGKCDYAVVADLFEIVPLLTRKLIEGGP